MSEIAGVLPFSILAVGSFPQTPVPCRTQTRANRLSVSSLLDRFLRRWNPARTAQELRDFQYPRCWIVSSDAYRCDSAACVVLSFSILAVGSFPQTKRRFSFEIPEIAFSILAVGSFPQTLSFFHRRHKVAKLSVSSLLDRFLRLLCRSRLRCAWHLSVSSLLDRFLRLFLPKRKRRRVMPFQYPHCWIVSSDPTWRRPNWRRTDLSVSSLLDRFLRRADCALLRKSFCLSVSSLLDRFLRPQRRFFVAACCLTFSILAVGSFPQTRRVNLDGANLGAFSILAVGSFPQTSSRRRLSFSESFLSVSSLLDRFLRLDAFVEALKKEQTFSILAVGSFPQTNPTNL